MVIVVIVVLEVRRVTVDQRVPVLVEPVKDPEPGEAAEAVRPKLVKRARLVEGEALVRDAVAAAACGFGGGPLPFPRRASSDILMIVPRYPRRGDAFLPMSDASTFQMGPD